jgi:predicted anti-sigma-YlaC factor YlaD
MLPLNTIDAQERYMRLGLIVSCLASKCNTIIPIPQNKILSGESLFIGVISQVYSGDKPLPTFPLGESVRIRTSGVQVNSLPH